MVLWDDGTWWHHHASPFEVVVVWTCFLLDGVSVFNVCLMVVLTWFFPSISVGLVLAFQMNIFVFSSWMHANKNGPFHFIMSQSQKQQKPTQPMHIAKSNDETALDTGEQGLHWLPHYWWPTRAHPISVAPGKQQGNPTAKDQAIAKQNQQERLVLIISFFHFFLPCLLACWWIVSWMYQIQ